MPYSRVRRKMRPYPGCDREKGSLQSAATAVHQAMKLLPGPGKPEGKKTALEIKGFLTLMRAETFNGVLKSTRWGARQYSQTALVDRSILKIQPSL